MLADSTITELLIKIGKKNKIEPTKVLDIMDAFYRGIYTTISEKRADVIKIPFFGKFMYNKDYKEKREKIFIAFNQLKLGKIEVQK